MNLERLRSTGRTTRMLKTAIALAKAGRAVYVLAASMDQRKWLESLLVELGGANLGISIEAPCMLGNLEWETVGLRGAHPNVVLLMDHHAIEKRFGPMLKELHAYDPKRIRRRRQASRRKS